METRWFVALAAAALAATVSCGPRATPEDCAGACRANAVELAEFHVCR